MTLDRKALVARALAEAALLKELKAEHDKTRALLAELFVDAGDREVGKLLDHRIGTVSLEAGAETWSVVDQDAFLAWVEAQNPDEVVATIEVRSSYQNAVLAACKRDGGVVVDFDTGAVEIPPGVAKRVGAPKIVERTEKHAGFVVRSWVAPHRGLNELLPIEAP